MEAEQKAGLEAKKKQILAEGGIPGNDEYKKGVQFENKGNSSEAVFWYKKAVELDNADAQVK